LAASTRFKNGFLHLSAPATLPGNGVLSILNDAEENLWVGTQAGLLRLSRTGRRLLRPRFSDVEAGS